MYNMYMHMQLYSRWGMSWEGDGTGACEHVACWRGESVRLEPIWTLDLRLYLPLDGTLLYVLDRESANPDRNAKGGRVIFSFPSRLRIGRDTREGDR